MPAGYIFWLVMLLWAIFGVGALVAWNTPYARWGYGGFGLLQFILFVLIGLKLFGSAIK